ncbi:hypothetical protein ACFRFQ_25345 [Rhodococcus sp. NPDC056743]|uniref:hypothetical protein n=1 Tax=Rhodococcus sp. NPDC056743 TaxID=3345934 RepID=UPI00366AD345
MLVQLTVDEHGGVRLVDWDTFTAFAVHAPIGHDVESVGKALEADAAGEVEDGRAWISADAVARLAGEAGAGDDWQSGFEAMVEYARLKGWLREDGAIRAHIEFD